ncbi:TPA: GlsB/YeaQ/YmgE family stress response membrane protein [Candidatus Peribacteria bacterium]|nr:MAG: transglycosylase [Candidatus Peribacteria bacterium RIFOXYC2_FULL_58_10]OGJ83698.1 MAG: transglycosylase [Candidatus Peribacteria bacterium RIFOXYD2_FULL_58_15]HAI98664.1 GlsB/YeaQ/YmgE family stress response membrane protein [Candidatus Peribacteria bacterium]HAS34377.1 GlsB/YeaQ/YmgE family stress response membrane protein [Candidatus Peribacteria bacterium]
MDILWFLIIGFIAGWLAGQIMGSGGYGIIGDIVIGIVGSLIGGLLFRFLGISAYGTLGTIVMAVIGAIVLIAALRTLKHA